MPDDNDSFHHGYANPNGAYFGNTLAAQGAEAARRDWQRNLDQLREMGRINSANDANYSTGLPPAAAKAIGLIALVFVAFTALAALYDKLIIKYPDSGNAAAISDPPIAYAADATPRYSYGHPYYRYHHHRHHLTAAEPAPSPEPSAAPNE